MLPPESSLRIVPMRLLILTAPLPRNEYQTACEAFPIWFIFTKAARVNLRTVIVSGPAVHRASVQAFAALRALSPCFNASAPAGVTRPPPPIRRMRLQRACFVNSCNREFICDRFGL